MTITPKEPSAEWLQGYLEPSLVAAKAYAIDTPHCPVKLDQNESPWDWPTELKKKIMDRVSQREWNRYPSAFSNELTSLLADYADVPDDCVLTTNGSNVVLGLLLNLLGRRAKGGVRIARPSFALYESHCLYEGIPFSPWELTADLEYDIETLSDLKEQSLVVFASPNNPVGNTLSYANLKKLLDTHPTSYFIADEAYFEFSGEPYTDLLKNHSNLIIVRTLSKTMGAAGLRIGYVVGAPAIVAALKKIRLPYLLNHFAVEGATLLLKDPAFKKFQSDLIEGTTKERSYLYNELKPFTNNQFSLKEPFANFLLLRWTDQGEAMRVYQGLIEHGILIRNVSGGPGMKGCLRATVGTHDENLKLCSALKKILSND